MQLRKSIPSILSEKHNRFKFLNLVVINDSLALVFSSRPIKMSPRFVLGRENVLCVAEVVNRSLMSRHLQHEGTCEVQREIHQAANSGQCTANLTTFFRVARSKKKK